MGLIGILVGLGLLVWLAAREISALRLCDRDRCRGETTR
jgi:hypothetical protein